MRRLLAVSLALYVIAVLAITGVFLVQQSIVYREHITPARRFKHDPVRVVITDDNGDAQTASVQFLDTYFLRAHGRMGNEIQEHMLVLLWLNISTVLLLALVCFAAIRLTPRSQWSICSPVTWLRRRRGLCVGCGYDLRGSKGRNACPECGASLSSPDQALQLPGT